MDPDRGDVDGHRERAPEGGALGGTRAGGAGRRRRGLRRVLLCEHSDADGDRAAEQQQDTGETSQPGTETPWSR